MEVLIAFPLYLLYFLFLALAFVVGNGPALLVAFTTIWVAVEVAKAFNRLTDRMLLRRSIAYRPWIVADTYGPPPA